MSTRTITRSLVALFAVGVSALLFTAPARAATASSYDELRQQDGRIQAIAEALLEGNVSLCRDLMALPGFVLHSRDQYGAAVAEDMFAPGADVAVAAVVSGSTADQAGLRRDDTVLAIDGSAPSDWPRQAEAPLRDGWIEVLDRTAAKVEWTVAARREGQELTYQLPTRPGCKALVEVLSVDEKTARSDGRVIQVSLGLARAASDGELAVILAHELAHDVLEHRKRLVAAGVSKGLLGELGRNQRLNRQAEVEADRLSVHLLANAALDPALAPAFWRSELGQDIGGGLLRNRIYPSPSSRAELLQREIADYLPLGAGPTHPGHLLSLRDAPMQ